MVESLLGRWLFSVISASPESREPLRNELLRSWTGESAEPFTVLWYVLTTLAEHVGAKDEAWISGFVQESTAVLNVRNTIDMAWIESTARVVLGDREASLPDIPPDTMVTICVVMCGVLARQVSDQALDAVISGAERAAVRQGLDIP